MSVRVRVEVKSRLTDQGVNTQELEHPDRKCDLIDGVAFIVAISQYEYSSIGHGIEHLLCTTNHQDSWCLVAQ